jgi:hypothetical protein
MRNLKNIELFEAWSSKFNRTLQGAYAKGLETGKSFGKSAKAVLDYANRSISQELFTIQMNNGTPPRKIAHDPEFILKPIEIFIKANGDLSKENNYLVIPIIVSVESPIAPKKNPYELIFKDNKIYVGPRDRKLTVLPTPEMEIRFLDRKSIEDFFAMTIQAILSSPEKTSLSNARQVFFTIKQKQEQAKLPGDTQEKQIILGLIQKIILDKDIRLYTM